jgi:hypothetical protein
MESVRSVLYLNFDNVFSALAKLDPKIAISSPSSRERGCGVWLTVGRLIRRVGDSFCVVT